MCLYTRYTYILFSIIEGLSVFQDCDCLKAMFLDYFSFFLFFSFFSFSAINVLGRNPGPAES